MDNGKAKQKVVVQIVSILLSIILWLYVTNTENPIRIINVNKVAVNLLNTNKLEEQGLALAPNQTINVNLSIEGSSADVYKINKDDFKIEIDLSEYALKAGDNFIPVNIVESPSNITIKNDSGLAAKVRLEELTKKEVAVEARIDVAAKVNYYVAPAEINPETITVSGPKSLVDQVNSLIVQGKEDNVSENIVKNYDVIPIDKNGYTVDGVKLSSERVQVAIKVNAGKSVPINLVTTGESNEGLKINSMKLSQEYVELSGPKDVLDRIDEIKTESVDLSQISDSVDMEVALIIPEEVEKSSTNYVKLSISVEKQGNEEEKENKETREIDVSVSTTGLKSGLALETSDITVKVVLSGYKKDLDLVNGETISASLDLSGITEAGKYTEKPVVNLSGELNNVEISSVGNVEISVINTDNTDNTFDEDTTESSFIES